MKGGVKSGLKPIARDPSTESFAFLPYFPRAAIVRSSVRFSLEAFAPLVVLAGACVQASGGHGSTPRSATEVQGSPASSPRLPSPSTVSTSSPTMACTGCPHIWASLPIQSQVR